MKTPVHRLPEFRRCTALPETERAADETLALPVDASLTKRDMQRVVAACNALGDCFSRPSEGVGSTGLPGV